MRNKPVEKKLQASNIPRAWFTVVEDKESRTRFRSVEKKKKSTRSHDDVGLVRYSRSAALHSSAPSSFNLLFHNSNATPTVTGFKATQDTIVINPRRYSRTPGLDI